MALRLALAVVAVLVTSGVVGATAGSESCSVAWWPQPRQSACAASSADNPAAPSPTTAATVALAWTYQSTGYLSAPVVANGVVYVQTAAAQKPRLRAFELATGKQLWDAFSGSGDSPPVVDGDVLLRVSQGWFLRRHGLRTGTIAWRRTVDGPTTTGWSGEPVAADHNVYISTGEDLVAYADRIGAYRWSHSLSCSRCGVAAAAGRVYAAGGRTVNAFDARSGATIWSTRVAGREPGSVVLSAGRLFAVWYVPSGKGKRTYYVGAFAAADGHPLWQTGVGAIDFFAMSTPLAATASLVVYASGDGNVYGLDARTGTQRWRHRLISDGNPAVVNGVVWIVRDKDASLVPLDARGGREISAGLPMNVSLTGRRDPSPIIAGNTILVSSPDGRLLAYRARP